MFYESLCVEFLALYLRWVLLELQRRYQITGSELTPSVHGGELTPFVTVSVYHIEFAGDEKKKWCAYYNIEDDCDKKTKKRLAMNTNTLVDQE